MKLARLGTAGLGKMARFGEAGSGKVANWGRGRGVEGD